MPEGKKKSGSRRKVFRKTPGGKTVVHYRKRKPSKAKCGGCGKHLMGVPRLRATKLKKMPKSSKRPERPYGGLLCYPCMRKELAKRAMKKQ